MLELETFSSTSARYNHLLGQPMPSMLAQILSDRLRRKGHDVEPVIIDLILNAKDDILKEEDGGDTTRFKHKVWDNNLKRMVEI